MGDNLVPNGLSRVGNEAGQPKAVVNFLDAEFLGGQHG
jgi:hypothetical protein